MMLKLCANFLLVFMPFVIALEESEKPGIREYRRYTASKTKNFAAPLGSYHSGQGIKGLLPERQLNLYQQQKYGQNQLKHPNSFQRPNEEVVNEIGGEKDSHETSVLETETKYADKSSNHSSPALSALALLGFLYYLNLIQGVLQGNNGRKRRSVEAQSESAEKVQDYLSSIEGLISKVSDLFPELDNEEGKAEGRSLNNRDPTSRRTIQERAFRIIDFIGSLLAKIPQTLGFGDQIISRKDYVGNSPQSSGPNFWNFFGRRVGLVARIMDFLENPTPSRVGRSFLSRPEVERNDIDPNEVYAEPSELSAEERAFLPFSSGEHSRKKRFTDDEMNIWYSEAVNHAEEETSSFSDNGKLIGMVFNLFKNALTSY